MATVKVQRIKSRNPKTNQPQYYVQTKSTGVMSGDDLVQNIVREMHIPEFYAEGVLKYLARAVFDYMKAGMSVQIPGLGTLKLNVTAKAVDQEKDATAATITGSRLQLIPLEKVKAEMAKFTYEMVPGTPTSEEEGGDVVPPEEGDGGLS